MGRTLIEAVTHTEGVQLTAAIERPESSLIGADAGELAGVGKNGVVLVDSIASVVDDFDVVIDFTAPAATVANVAVCRQAGRQLVIGTTGCSREQLDTIEAATESIAICMAANYSVGVNLCFKLADIAARVLGDEVDIESVTPGPGCRFRAGQEPG
jgi:4-hydroxy-tetrahydrodipicolinate reductase